MKILQYGSLNATDGGPAVSTALTIRGIRSRGHICEIVSPISAPGSKSTAPEVKPFEYPFSVWHPFRNRRGISSAGEFDLYHIQGCWSVGGHAMCRYAASRKIPYVVTLRGMLYPQALAAKSMKKRLALALYQMRDLRGAACIQATCREELEHYRALGGDNPVAVIPNAIELPAMMPDPPVRGEIFRVGYLGRIHPRKRVERLIRALADERLKDVPLELVIIGSDNPEYETFLHNEVRRLKLDNVRFSGFLTGIEKEMALRDLNLLAVPSDFENFGNIVTEALMQGIPVVASKGMPWRELDEYRCGWWIDNRVEDFARVFADAAALTSERLAEMGRNGQRLLHERYGLSIISGMLEQTYLWCVGEAGKPDFISC